jgi:hypothetical protein
LSPAVTLTGPAFAEVLVADDAVRVDEVQRRPVAVGERAPDLVGVVDRDRVVDLALLGRLPHAVRSAAALRENAYLLAER